MLALLDVLDLFVNEFPGLCRRGLPFPRIFSGPLNDFFLRHV